MGRYSGYLICTDLDGTFIDNKSQLIEENLEAVSEYMKNGGLFTVSTGRAEHYLKSTYGERLKINTHLICLNGTMIFDTENNKIIYSTYMDREDILGIDEYGGNTEGIYFHTQTATYMNFDEVPRDGNIHKIVFVNKTEEETLALKEKLEKRYGDVCDFCRSWPMGLEVLPKGAGKGDCIRKLREILGNKIHTVVAVGDFENDLTMLREADIGVAVSNAVDFVKAAADKITVSNEEGAIAKIIKDIKV